MKIIIEKDEKTGDLSVWQDGKTTGSLTIGEALEHILALLMTVGPASFALPRRYQMKTPEEWAKPWNEQQKEDEQ